MLDLSVFLQINGLLLSFLVDLLPCEEVSDEFVEAVVLGLPQLLALDLLLVMNEHVVAVRLLDTLVQLHLPQHLGSVQCRLVLVQLALQLLLLVVVLLLLIVLIIVV